MNKLKIILISLIFLFGLNSCSKVNKYPSINFIGGKDIVSQDAVLKLNSQFKIGINSYSNSDFKLYKFKLIRVFDNNPQIVVDSIINSDNFNAILNCPTSDEETSERWLFSITTSDGYTSEISVKIISSDTLNIIESEDNIVKNYIIDDLPNNDLKFYYIISGILILFIIIFIIKNLRLRKRDRIKEKKTNNLDKNKNKYDLYVIISVIILLVFIAKLMYDNVFL